MINQTANNTPTIFALDQNFPNPFNPITKIRFSISSLTGRKIFVKLVVYDAIGKEISILVNEEKYTGNYEVQFDGGNLPSGVYFYSLNLGKTNVDVEKMILLK
ncbi:MAG: T9SS type A sorting domain-containing protein [Ignavibacteria bacterium]|nr:T9SS type A sorting domain-containing protein [Ignavibacteria bacterium]